MGPCSCCRPSVPSLLAPKGTHAAVVQRLPAETRKAIAQPALNDKLTATGAIPVACSPGAFAALINAEMAKWSTPARR